jgi:hypothetical protein
VKPKYGFLTIGVLIKAIEIDGLMMEVALNVDITTIPILTPAQVL